jgi:hypothetical protein
MAGGVSNDLLRRIQHDLASGRSREEVVQELVADGLSRPGAERFVDRAIAAPPVGTSPRELDEAARRSREEASGDSSSLAYGAFWLSLSLGITAVIFLLTNGGKTLLFGPALVSVGLVLFVRGLLRWRDSFAPPPWGKVIAAGAVPVLASVAFVGFVSLRESRLQEAEARAEAEREMQEEREEAERSRQQAETAEWQRARLEEAREAHRERNAKRIQRNLQTLRGSSRLSSICSAATYLARLEVYEAIPDLEDALLKVTNTSVQNCIAAALVDLGATHTALNFYIDGARSRDRERRRLAIGSLGDLGPDAAEVTLPYLEHALRSTEQSDRFAAVLALAKMGEAGEPLLRQALEDPDPRVSGYAAQALGRSPGN